MSLDYKNIQDINSIKGQVRGERYLEKDTKILSPLPIYTNFGTAKTDSLELHVYDLNNIHEVLTNRFWQFQN